MITINAMLGEDRKSVKADFHFKGTGEEIVKESAAVIMQLPKNVRSMSEKLYFHLMAELVGFEFIAEDTEIIKGDDDEL